MAAGERMKSKVKKSKEKKKRDQTSAISHQIKAVSLGKLKTSTFVSLHFHMHYVLRSTFYVLGQ
jgi:hypothetical protein